MIISINHANRFAILFLLFSLTIFSFFNTVDHSSNKEFIAKLITLALLRWYIYPSALITHIYIYNFISLLRYETEMWPDDVLTSIGTLNSWIRLFFWFRHSTTIDKILIRSKSLKVRCEVNKLIQVWLKWCLMKRKFTIGKSKYNSKSIL